MAVAVAVAVGMAVAVAINSYSSFISMVRHGLGRSEMVTRKTRYSDNSRFGGREVAGAGERVSQSTFHVCVGNRTLHVEVL